MSGMRTAKRCSNCAVRKISCDRKSPSCSQCLLTGKSCSGYHRQIVFVQHEVGVRKTRRRGNGNPEAAKRPKDADNEQGAKKARSGPAIKFRLIHTEQNFSTEQDYLVSVIIEHFTPAQEVSLVDNVDGSAACLNSRVCGAWVTLLPDIVSRSLVHLDILQCGIKSLGYSILGKVSSALEAYGETLCLLRGVLDVAGEDSLEELLAAMLCLSISEVLLGTAHDGWSAHTHGISKLVQERGPETFQGGVLHQLYSSFRVFMVLGAIQQRKKTFLDEYDWKMIPSSSESKSLMQSLLDQVCGLPSQLQRLDTISRLSHGSHNKEITGLYIDFLSQIIILEEWEANLKSNSENNLLWWPVTSFSSSDTTIPISYQFASILIANTMSHYWGFLLIVQISIEALRAVTSKHVIDLPFMSKHGAELSQHKKVTIAKDICKSMQYHLQPEMKLYGPAATLFPVTIAWQIFRGAKMTEEAAWCEDFIARLGRMGIRLAPHVPWIEGKQS